MKLLAELIDALDGTRSTKTKIELVCHHFRHVPEDERIWHLAILLDRRPARAVSSTQLRQWGAEISGLPDWLFEQTYHAVGDLAETLSIVLPDGDQRFNARSLPDWIAELKEMRSLEVEEKKVRLLLHWSGMSRPICFVYNKLITGGFRMGVSRGIVIKALSQFLNKEENFIAHRLTGKWEAQKTTFEALFEDEEGEEQYSRPYPFFLASALECNVEELGEVADWQIEYKWDGIRLQWIHRKNTCILWSRGEEQVNESFPELLELSQSIPEGCVLDGELLAWSENENKALPFTELQKRLGRKKPSKAIQQKTPVYLMVYDVLEWEYEDLRALKLVDRRSILEQKLRGIASRILISDTLEVQNWEEAQERRSQARALEAEGLMLKRKSSPYQVGRKRGDWYKWKTAPFTADAVLLYAMAGHGRRANLYTDYTFGIRSGDELVPFAKAYSGLTDKEIVEVDKWIRQNTLERFGPVRSVKAELVFELAFESIQLSSRHKSGVAVRFPRILRWRKDKTISEIDRLEDIREQIRTR